MVISSYLLRLIINNRNSIKFRLKIESFILEQNMRSNDYDAKINKTLVCNDIFQPILSKNLTDDTKAELNKEIDDEEPTRMIDVYLFNLNAMTNNKKVVNFVAQNCKIKDAIGYIVKQFKVDSLLMSTPNNNTRYEQIINPPLNLRNSLEYLSNTYGIYNNGIRQFYDLTTYYILSNDVKNVPVKYGEFPNVYIHVCKLKEDGSLNQGSYADDVYKCYIVNTNNMITLSSNGVMNKELNGNKIRVYNRESLENAVTYDEKNGKFKFNKGYTEKELDIEGYGNADKISYVFNNSADANVSTVEANMKYSNIEFSLQFNTIDLDIFTPNRNYIFRFEDSKYIKYNGNYIMDALMYVIDNTVGEAMGVGKFRKVN